LKNYLKNVFKASSPRVLDLVESVYHFLPPSIRYGRDYTEMLGLFRLSEEWDYDRLVAYQEDRLRKLIRHSYSNVPYYREIMDQRGLAPDDVARVQDLEKLPFLDKKIVKERNKDLAATNMTSKQVEHEHTTGTTGPSMSFLMDNMTRAVERAQAMRRLIWLGYHHGDRIAVLKGIPLSGASRLFKYFRGSRELRFSLVKSDDDTLESIYNKLVDFKPRFISGWPSSLFRIGRWMSKNDRKLASIDFALTSSENLYPHYKRSIESAFGAKVIDLYGQKENVAVAIQCREARGYHVQMETGIVELVPYKGKVSEIVGTSLFNFAMPLIRYKTGDLAVESCEMCVCGRKSPLLERIIGRTSDVVVDFGGQTVFPGLTDFPLYKFEEVRESQIVLHDEHTLLVNLVGWEKLPRELLDHIGTEMREMISPSQLIVQVSEVDQISPNPGGKTPFVVSRSPVL
jgi:phenylacetate-CoA ligase